MSTFTFRVTDLEHGWAVGSVSAEGVEAHLLASHLSDGLGDLIRSAWVLLEGAPYGGCEWQDEPGESRWRMRRVEGGLEVRILRHAEPFSKEPDERGEEVLATVCSVLRFATQVRGQFQLLLNQYGERGYEERWHYPFPRGPFESVSRLIPERKREHARR